VGKEALRAIRRDAVDWRRLGFSFPDRSERPVRRDVLRDAWQKSEKAAKLERVPFNRHVYGFKPPRELAGIDAERQTLRK
jgi:hypothetical protein